MDSARHIPSRRLYLATEFGNLDPSSIALLLDDLICPECTAPAYFVPRTRRGTTYFGARPHNQGCQHSPRPSTTLAGSIPETEARLLAENAFTIRPHRPSRAAPQVRIEHDPDASTTDTLARRYTRAAGNTVATPSVGLKTMLRKLLLEPGFKNSDTTIHIETYSSTIRRYVFNVDDVGPRHVSKRRLYWGTIYKATNGVGGNAWLHTRGTSPNLLVPKDLLEILMADNGMTSISEFVGTAFITRCYLNLKRDRSGTYLKVNDPFWTAIIPDPDAPN